MSAPPPLSIAHVSGERGFSGGEVQVFLLLEGLRERGHSCRLVCPPDSRGEREARRRGFAVLPVTMRNDFSLGAVRRIVAGLADSPPDLVHCHSGRANWLGGLAARRLGRPALSTRRMDRRIKRGLRTRWLYGSLLRRVAAISPAVVRRLEAGGVDSARIRLIWSAVDPAALAPSAPRETLRRRLGVGPEQRCALVAANLVRRKGIDVLLEAWAKLGPPAGAQLWIAGEGPERAALEERSRSLGPEPGIAFLGRRGDVPDLLEACDVFVLPSRQEGLGVAALEAMARGRPVLASRVGGLGECVVHERTGLLVPPDDPAALAAALGRLLDEPALAAELGRAGALRADEHFRAATMVGAYEALYREILAESAAGARA